jgi:hypothetical protein
MFNKMPIMATSKKEDFDILEATRFSLKGERLFCCEENLCIWYFGIYLILRNLLFLMSKRSRDTSKKLYKYCFSTETDNTTEDSLIPQREN